MKTTIIIASCLCGVLNAATISIPASVDGAVQSSGVLGLSVTNDTINSTLRSGGANIRQSIFEFDISTISSSALVTEAYFEFDTTTASNTGGNPVEFRIDGFVGDGVIGTGDFDSNEASGGDLVYSGDLVTGSSANTSLSLQLTDLTSLQSAITSGEDYFGLRTETNNFATLGIRSLENTTGADPVLRLVVVPEPSVSFLASFACLFLFRRRRA